MTEPAAGAAPAPEEAMSLSTPEPENTSIGFLRRSAGLGDTWTDERIRTVWKMCAPKAKSITELSAFLAVAAKYGLDPVLGEIFLMSTEAGPKIFVPRDALLKTARRDPDYSGFVSGVVHEQDSFSVQRSGHEVTVEHGITGIKRGGAIGAYCIAYHKTRDAVCVVRAVDDYKHLLNRLTWKMYLEDMIETRCISAAHRRLVELSGVYTDAEVIDEEGRDAVVASAVQSKTSEKTSELRAKLEALRSPEPAPAPEPVEEPADAGPLAE